jgi:molybdate transport repressor ModE-like protein
MRGTRDGLHLLLSLARTGSITQAAQELNYSRTHAGRLIKQVEDWLGVELRERKSHGTELSA